MNLEQLSSIIKNALSEAIQAKQLQVKIPENITVERPRNRAHGDWSTNIAMQLVKEAGLPPHKIAKTLQAYLTKNSNIQTVDIAGPGFLNITMTATAAADIVPVILTAKDSYGTNKNLAHLNINLEFVSANPTGPIHLGGTRWAALGDSLARILKSQGAKVVKEYYVNDHGTQIDRFALSLLAAAHKQPTPKDGYGGEYIQEIAQKIVNKNPQILQLNQSDAQLAFRNIGMEIMLKEIKKSLHDFGVDFDIYFHETTLHKNGEVTQVLEQLKTVGSLYFEAGAWWLKSSQYGDSKDRVVIKSDGLFAYIAADLAYLKNKSTRGFDLCIYLLGADHHGYISRLKAAAAAFGKDPENVEVLIGQMVNLIRDGKAIKMSKRAGNVVTMEDLIEAVGVDAARYSLVRCSSNSNIDIDINLLTNRSNDNPVFYVQYAHARTCSVARNAHKFGINDKNVSLKFDGTLLVHTSETELLANLSEFPTIVSQAAEFRQPHRLARYLENLAADYHKWFGNCRVLPIGEEPISNLHLSRLHLNNCVQQVLVNGLNLLGVTAPERM